MLEKNVAQNIIDYALSRGADFCEIFVDKQRFESSALKNSKIENVSNGINFGIGIRLFFGLKVLYGYTNQNDTNSLLKIVETLTVKDLRNQTKEIKSLNFESFQNKHLIIDGLSSKLSLDEKLPFLINIDRFARAASDKVIQVNAGYSQYQQNIQIYNSEGLATADERNWIRLNSTVIAKDGNIQDYAYYSPGAMMGWNFVSAMNPEAISEKLVKVALTKLSAKPCPAGQMPVVIDNGFGGVIFHEACGHSLETTSVAKKASVFHDKMGEVIASSVVSAVDDGTIENYWGSINIDDEGMKTQKTQLIKNGVLTSFMVDKLGGMKTGFERTGSGRRESYKYAPTSRMRNTYIEAGQDKFEDMIKSIDNGLYCKQMGGGSVSPGTGEFNFAADECYLIENGKITTPVKGATLIGSGADVLKQISMVADNLDLAAGVCGSVSGGVFTTVGQPAIKVDSILVGGAK